MKRQHGCRRAKPLQVFCRILQSIDLLSRLFHIRAKTLLAIHLLSYECKASLPYGISAETIGRHAPFFPRRFPQPTAALTERLPRLYAVCYAPHNICKLRVPNRYISGGCRR
jgi:hypothetical protein